MPAFEELRSVRVVYYLPAANANTQTTNEDFILLQSIRDASTQTADEDFKFLKQTQEVGTQTADEDFIHVEPTQETGTQTTDEDFVLPKPTRDAIIQTAKKNYVPFELISDSNIQSTKEDFIQLEPSRHKSTQIIDTDYILRKHVRFKRTLSSLGNLSLIKASDINNIQKTSADTNEVISITWIICNNGCCIGNVDLSSFFFRLKVPTIVNAPRIQKIPNDMQKSYEVPKINKKINVPNHQRITMKAPMVKRSKYNTHGTSNPVLLREKAQCGVNHLHSKANQKPSDNNLLVGTHQNSLTSSQENLKLKKIGNLTGNRYVTIPRFQKDALNTIFSLNHQNKYVPSKISYSEWPAEGIDSVSDTSKVKDLSCFHENKIIPNLRKNKFQPEILSEDHPVSSEQKNQPLCCICKTAYTGHEPGKDLHKCYICRYTSNKKRDLPFPTYFQHPEKILFNTCEEEFTENDLKATELTCGMCFEAFQSEARLEKHALVHEDYNLSHCRVCKWEMSAHVVEYLGKRRYQCCGCCYRTIHSKYLHQHLNTHVSLKLFRCYMCDSRFSEKKSLERHFKNTHKRSYE